MVKQTNSLDLDEQIEFFTWVKANLEQIASMGKMLDTVISHTNESGNKVIDSACSSAFLRALFGTSSKISLYHK
jgi:N-acetylglucosamine kinase-like BadF-type ATPase